MAGASGRIPATFIDDLLARVDIVDVIEPRVRLQPREALTVGVEELQIDPVEPVDEQVLDDVVVTDALCRHHRDLGPQLPERGEPAPGWRFFDMMTASENVPSERGKGGSHG